MENKQEIIKALQSFLEHLGIEKNENTEKTPERIIKAWSEMCRGINKDEEIDKILSIDFSTEYTGMITFGPLNIFSLCSHHLLPIDYKVYIGYIPSNKKVIGFSKISQAIALMASKPQNQEDFTQEVADRFIKALDPEGFGLLVLGKHHCMHARSNGIHHYNALTITSAFRRSFRTSQATREEFYKNIDISNQNQ